jgi:hypothetical protein
VSTVYLCLASVGLILALHHWRADEPAPPLTDEAPPPAAPTPGLRLVSLALLFAGTVGAALTFSGRDLETTAVLAAAVGLPAGLIAGAAVLMLRRRS